MAITSHIDDSDMQMRVQNGRCMFNRLLQKQLIYEHFTLKTMVKNIDGTILMGKFFCYPANVFKISALLCTAVCSRLHLVTDKRTDGRPHCMMALQRSTLSE